MMVRRTICRMAGQGKTARQTLAKLRSLTNVLSREDLVVPSLTTIECVRARFAKTGSAAPAVRSAFGAGRCARGHRVRARVARRAGGAWWAVCSGARARERVTGDSDDGDCAQVHERAVSELAVPPSRGCLP